MSAVVTNPDLEIVSDLNGAMPDPPQTADDGTGPLRRWKAPTATIMATAAGVAGWLLGLRPIHDNSFLTHLATGRLLLHGTFPRHDPYSFTAHGATWVIESWIPSLLYALTERVFGSHGLVLLQAGLSTLLALLAWRLTRAARSLPGRQLTIIVALVASALFWSSRPFMVGLLCLGATILLSEDDRLPSWWLLPLGWVWVNSHGSWPLGIGYLIVRYIGRRIDQNETGRLTNLLRWSIGGICLGAISPFGPQLLLFPLHMLTRHAVLSHVVEWQSPSFTSLPTLVFLAYVLVTLCATGRGGWEDKVPSVLFVAMAMVSIRNIPVASLVLIPVLARNLPTISGSSPRRSLRVPAVAFVALAVLGTAATVRMLARPAYDLSAYPVSELAWMRDRGLLTQKIAAPDFVGNFRTWSEGAHNEVFIDDRYDMYSPTVSEGEITLLQGLPGWDGVLDRYGIRFVLWPRRSPLSQILARDGHWKVLHETTGWVVVARNR